MDALRAYDPTLFKGAAWYYARYRPRYPSTLFALLSEAFNLNGQGRLLDLGCGTGQIAIPLCDRFDEVVGIDPQPEMLIEAQREAAMVGASNITWVEQRAELISQSLGFFKLVTIGRAFRWMDEKVVLQRCYELLLDDGGLAIISTGGSFWKNSEPWKQKTIEVVKKWRLGEQYTTPDISKKDLLARSPFALKNPDSSYTRSKITKKDLLVRSPFARVAQHQLEFEHIWTIENIIGYLYSTSFCSRTLLGDQVTQFEADLKEALLSLELSGQFKETKPLSVLLAWKR
ncbi:class I SAM-dependent methyltransferase [Fischerella sp. PCC 9605]|uniref:class I SAM-dependent methyltransferase n=1 Tax=Fischerella sp. PCC 9605 TaxID=1173024 RepID=UPI00047B89D7|nr:class I SAM-dependent methyltransferase [Fischerella sp. PCC 9605]